MAQAWDAEIEVGSELATRLIAHQFQDLAGLPVAPFSSGWDNTAFLVDGQWVFRFPRRHCAIPLLACEMRALPSLARMLPLAVPAPVFTGQPESAYPHPFTGYRLIPGRTACRAHLDDAARRALAGPLAVFLRALHAIPPALATELGIPADTIRRLDVAHRGPRAIENITGMVARGDASSAQAASLRDILAKAADCRSVGTTTLVHGDLYVRHLVVDDDGRLHGIIDWGDCHRGDAAMDLGIVFAVLTPEARQDFFAVYGPISDDTRRLARFRAMVHLGYLSGFAHDIGDQELIREIRREVGLLVAE